MRTEFVTGGSGFIGQALVSWLVRDGHEMRALARSTASAELVQRAWAVPVMRELTDPGALRAGMLDADVVFHHAAQTDLVASRQSHLDVTVEGTRAVLTAAQDTEVARVVHCSSEASLMAGESLADADDSEQLVADSNSHRAATVVVRPRFVYGPDSNLIPGLARAELCA